MATLSNCIGYFMARASVLFTGAVLLASVPGFTQKKQTAPSAISIEKNQVQLFIDDFLIESQEGLKRTLHQPKKDDGGNTPVIALNDGEFGDQLSTLEANGSIVFDARIQKYVMFALGFSPPNKGWDRIRMYRFTSVDGIHWIKGDDGKPEVIYPKSQEIFYDGEVFGDDEGKPKYTTNLDVGCFYYDENDEAYPYKAWQYFFANRSQWEGLYYMRSKDGKEWERGEEIIPREGIRIHQDGLVMHGPGDVNAFSWDPVTKRFLVTIKVKSTEQVAHNNFVRARAYIFTERLDAPIDPRRITRVALMPAVAKENGDEPWDEYYSSTAWRYGSMFIGGLRIWHGSGDYPYSRAGCAYLKLASSRDGLHWTKVPYTNDEGVPEVWIPNGAEGGNSSRNDGGYMTEFSQGPLRVGDELIFYYGSSSWGKSPHHGDNDVRITGGGIFRARLRIDGFVSVDRGVLTTKPLALKGEKLFINAIGPVVVELLDVRGKVLSKATVEGDHTNHEIDLFHWSRVSSQRDQLVKLRFTIGNGGKLFSFTNQ